MSRKKYRKWTIQDMRKLRELRQEGLTWAAIADMYGEKKTNLIQIYTYYKPVLEEMDVDRSRIISKIAASNVTGLSERMIGSIYDPIVSELNIN